MKMKLVLWCLVVLMVACQVPEKKNDSIVITVDVKQIPDMGFVISYWNSHTMGIEFDEKGHGECIIEGPDALFLTLHNGFSEQKILYAEKGDHLHLSFDGKSMEETLVVTGARQPIQDYLSQVKIDWPKDEMYKLDFPEYIEYLYNRVDSNLMFLDSRKTELEKVSKKFAKLEEYRIRCSMSFMLLQYPRGHGWASGNQAYRPGKEYYAEIQKWMIEDPELFDLYEYRILMSEGAAIIAEHRTKYSTPYQKVILQMDYAATTLKNDRVKQCLMNMVACDYIDLYGIDKTSQLNQYYRENVKDKDLTAQYDRIYGEWKKLAPGNALPEFTAVDSTGKSYSLKDFRGQKVCLYIWQNIYPCLKEYPYLDTLQSSLKENNVRLICLAIDSEKENWMNAIRQKTTEPVTHLYMGFDRKYLRSIRYRGSSMFQFLLLDEEGKIIEWKIPAPSSGKLAAYLEKKLDALAENK